MSEDQATLQGPLPPLSTRYSETHRAIFSASAHHGKPLRGLMSTAKSPNFEGRFGATSFTITSR